MKKALVCIVCPKGCQLTVELKENDELIVTGNNCKKGIDFAFNELKHPMRSLSTTVKTLFSWMPVLPVRTNGGIPKELIFEAMKVLNKVVISKEIKCGEVILSDLLGTGCEVIATADLIKGGEK